MNKRTLWKYGTIQTPVEVGRPVWYVQHGFLRKTENVERILESTEDHVTFETQKFYYCFEYQNADEAVCLAA